MMKRYAYFSIVAWTLMMLLCPMFGCKTIKNISDKQENHSSVHEDSVFIEQSGVGESIDRQTITRWFAEWYAMHQQQHIQHDTEQTEETITTTTDSVGNITKTEHRTTNRSMASQSTQSEFDLVKEYKYTIDSLSSRIEGLELKISAMSAQSSNDSEIKQTHKETKSMFSFPLWVNIVIVIGFAFGLYLFIRKTFRL